MFQKIRERKESLGILRNYFLVPRNSKEVLDNSLKLRSFKLSKLKLLGIRKKFSVLI